MGDQELLLRQRLDDVPNIRKSQTLIFEIMNFIFKIFVFKIFVFTCRVRAALLDHDGRRGRDLHVEAPPLAFRVRSGLARLALAVASLVLAARQVLSMHRGIQMFFATRRRVAKNI